MPCGDTVTHDTTHFHTPRMARSHKIYARDEDCAGEKKCERERKRERERERERESERERGAKERGDTETTRYEPFDEIHVHGLNGILATRHVTHWGDAQAR